MSDQQLAYTVTEAAAAVGLSSDEIRRAVYAEELPAKQRGRRILISRDRLLTWFESLPDYEPPNGGRP